MTHARTGSGAITQKEGDVFDIVSHGDEVPICALPSTTCSANGSTDAAE